MKKLIILIVALFITITINAQKVIFDKYIGDSIRVSETTGICARSFTDRVIWNFGLKSYQYRDKSIGYMLIINLNAMYEMDIKNNGLLLIKTFNDDVIELQNALSEHSSVNMGYSYVRPLIGNIGTISSNDIHRNVAYFFITEADLKKLNAGIKKVRVEVASGAYVEKDYKKDKAGQFLYKSYETLKNEMSVPAPSVRDNF